MNSETDPEVLIATEISRWLRLRPNTVYYWAATGKIPSIRLNGTVRFLRADIERWIQEHSNGASHSNPSTTSPIVTRQPMSVSPHALRQAGTRAIRRVMGQQSSRQIVTSQPRRSSTEIGERKDNR